MSREIEQLLDPDVYFGRGRIPGENNFFPNLDLEDRVRVAGMLNACPVPNLMIETFSLEWIIDRYTECNLVGYVIEEKARELNPGLYDKMTTDTDRLAAEIPENFELEAVPTDYQEVLRCGASAVGYAASRILIEQFGREEGPWKIGSQRVKRGYELLEEALRESVEPTEFIVRLADLVTDHDADTNAVLGHLLAVELTEESLYSQIHEIGDQMRRNAPGLWEYYLSLTPEQREEVGILQPGVVGV